MEFMAVSSSPYDTDRFGAALPRFSPRQADLLMVVGTVTHKQAPVLLKVYEQMCEPKWVMAFGVCATSGGFYQNYAAVLGIDKIIPVDVYVPGCPPRPEMVIDGIMQLQDKIARSQHLDPHAGLLTVGADDPRPLQQRARAGRAAGVALAHGVLVVALSRRRRCRRRASACKSEFGFDLFLDVTAVDWPGQAPRFEVV